MLDIGVERKKERERERERERDGKRGREIERERERAIHMGIPRLIKRRRKWIATCREIHLRNEI